MRFAAIALLLFMLPFSLTGAPRVWTVESRSGFEKGQFEHVSLEIEGELTLAPVPELLFEGDGESFIWSVAVQKDGGILAGTGPSGKLFRRPAGQEEWVLLIDSPEVAFTSLAVTDDGTVYGGTIPSGYIYRMKPGARPEIFAESGERYVWSVALNPAGGILAGTGPEGKLLSINEAGETEVLLDSEDDHILSVLADEDGSILAGTSGHGLLYRIGKDGNARVILDAPQKEIRAVLRHGPLILAAAVTGLETLPASKGAAASGPAVRKRASGSTASSGSTTATTGVWRKLVAKALRAGKPTPVPAAPIPAGKPPKFGRMGTSKKQQLYGIGPDGLPVPLFSSDQEVLLSLARSGPGVATIGTGNSGVLFRVGPGTRVTRWANLSEDQIMCLAPDPSGGLLVGTGNPGRLYRMPLDPATRGTWMSQPLDAGLPARWGHLSWSGRGLGSVHVSTRSGGSKKPDFTWSDWSPSLADEAGSPVQSPAGRFLQVRVELDRTGARRPPVFERFRLLYTTVNAAPSVDSVKVASAVVRVHAQHPEPSSRHARKLAEGRKKVPPRWVRKVTWKASDLNDDELWSRIDFRGEGERNWQPALEEPTAARRIDWDTRKLPDGVYRVRVTVGDSWSRPEPEARTASHRSAPFVIDHTPPEFGKLKVLRPGRGRVSIFGSASDATSRLLTIEYSVDHEEWQLATITDGLADKKKEAFSIRLRGLTRGEHTVTLVARDRAGNVGNLRQVIDVR